MLMLMFKSDSIHLNVSFFDLPVLNMLPQVVADGSEGGVDLYAEVTPVSNGSFVCRAFLITEGERQRKEKKKNC